MEFTVTFKTKWADFDANRHMRHTAYNDYAAEVRVRYFKEHGMSIEDFAKENLGPILFKEETNFYKEIHIGEDITVNLTLKALSKNLERWKLQHQIFNEADKLAAQVNVYGAWIDLEKRKLSAPSEKFKDLFSSLDRTEDFEEIILKR
ncbi:1,4-dihydroxy-2-naphthoyl-CoA hydrolase [Polaribacter huanghezhanensis]|uniref:acyl-CoA thioesterase n=1 Tax=Polaribacter huanghezhanensis TaxID=1354726 RepID=UPI00264900E7|nr:acyl-CoA thioesterase [Polaribacter huanghezhanensis]WKD85990.1 1,4-dihydroxy-2-naphthoyl-CoA hydrolase [Polaribacter huanghezhanensis]